MPALINIMTVMLLVGLARQATDPILQAYNVPDQVERVLVDGPLSKTYELSFHINPFYLRADYNGDGWGDFAVLVKQRNSGKFGVAVVDGRSSKVTILGAGSGPRAGGDDYAWMDYWYVYPKGPVQRGAGERRVPQLRGDALLMGKSESASGLIYWDGKRFTWYQQGD